MTDLSEFIPEMRKSLLVPEPKGHKNEPEGKKTWVKWYPAKGKTFDEIIESAEELGRDYFVVAMSGGKDSVSVADMLDRRGKVKGVFHIDTAVGTKGTHDFVKDLCQSRGWPLYIREPTPFRYVYAAMVLQIGFPGPAMHSLFMNYLKLKVMKKFVREPQFKGKGLALASGIRSTESVRRMGNYDEPIWQDGQMWVIAPWFYESTENIYRYFIENGLKKTPIHDILGFSGECNCGSFAMPSEATKLQQADPVVAEYIMWLEQGIKQFGTDTAKKYGKWGSQGMTPDEAQTILSGFPGWEELAEKAKIVCGSECGPSTMRGAGLI